MSFNMHIPKRILIGVSELNNLYTQKMPDKEATIVISKGKSTRTNGCLARTENQLKLSACGIFANENNFRGVLQ